MVEQATARAAAAPHPGVLAAIRDAARDAGGALPFDTFMEIALYHPQCGYYARERKRVGRKGDFITSVSIGRCFGLLLARRFAPEIERLARRAGELLLVEAGPEDSSLAEDLLAELEGLLKPETFARLSYVALTPFASGDESGTHVRDWSQLSGARGVVFANEVLDAMPVKRLRWSNNAWREQVIVPEGDGLRTDWRSIEDGPLFNEIAELPADLREGFTIELNMRLDPWFAGLSAAFDELYGCLIDYGLESAEFFDASRSDGTLRAYALHRVIEDPVAVPGGCDITAHVDFGRAARAARAAGLDTSALSDQHRFLVEAGRDWLLGIERAGVPDAATASLLRQFQSLTHPGAMGAAFKVLEIGKRA